LKFNAAPSEDVPTLIKNVFIFQHSNKSDFQYVLTENKNEEDSG